MAELIDRQDAITALSHMCSEDEKGITVSRANVDSMLKSLPPAQPEERTAERTETRACDSIGRQMAIDAIDEQIEWCDKSLSSFDISMKDEFAVKVERASLVAFRETLECLPSAQPERTCVNCGRTANNGGWYADGGTRCPIEEHYALPKDGYCHLWEKRNITDDDYPERRTDD